MRIQKGKFKDGVDPHSLLLTPTSPEVAETSSEDMFLVLLIHGDDLRGSTNELETTTPDDAYSSEMSLPSLTTAV